jgi:hypothetical protein
MKATPVNMDVLFLRHQGYLPRRHPVQAALATAQALKSV